MCCERQKESTMILTKALQTLNAGAAIDTPQQIYKAILGAYQEPHRRYHTFSHIEHMLAILAVMQNSLQIDQKTLNLMILAIADHNYIYVPAYTKNVLASAYLAETHGRMLGLSKESLTNLRGLVLDTEHTESRVRGLLDTTVNFERKLIQDIDLAIFAAPWKYFCQYDENMKEEYILGGFSLDSFKRERFCFLQHYLGKDRLYITDCCHYQFEEKARKNIKRLLAERYT